MKDGFVKVGSVSPILKVGNPLFNSEAIIKFIKQAAEERVKVLVFPELSITGYTCGDLFFQRTLLKSASLALSRIVESTKNYDTLVFVGYPLEYGGKLFNTAAAIQRGKILAFIAKKNLPTYAEFYETRWFTPSLDENIILETEYGDVVFGNKIILEANAPSSLRVGAEICEDLWVADPPSTHLSLSGATLIVNLSASDELTGKEDYRVSLVQGQSARTLSSYIYCGASEGESTTDMVFTGANVIAEDGVVLLSRSYSLNELITTEIDVDRLENERIKRNTFPLSCSEYTFIPFELEEEETVLTRDIPSRPFVPGEREIRDRRCEKVLFLQSLGLKRRIEHTSVSSCVLGLSGGLDSTLALLVTVRAFDALKMDRKNIKAISMPCFGTTNRTKSNAEKLAIALGVDYITIDITSSVKQHFLDIEQSEDDYSTTYENAQARERTQVLMDWANKIGALVVGTGDLSELALGWATYNGDHMSMYGVNAGVPKTLVRALVEYVRDNSNTSVSSVLSDILLTPVSPELLPPKEEEISQVTEDLVGPYALHDFFIYCIVRQSFGAQKTFRLAQYAFKNEYDRDTIYKWLRTFIKRFFSQQFKRSCLPDGPKVGAVTLSPRSDWRMPSDADRSVWLKELDEAYNLKI